MILNGSRWSLPAHHVFVRTFAPRGSVRAIAKQVRLGAMLAGITVDVGGVAGDVFGQIGAQRLEPFLLGREPWLTVVTSSSPRLRSGPSPPAKAGDPSAP